MGITNDNYEQYFLDYTEGRLSPEMEQQVLDFLRAHPDLKALLEDFDASPLPADEPDVFRHKAWLIKSIRSSSRIHAGNIEDWLISSVEGLLHDEEEKELREFLEMNPAYQYDHRLFKKSKLTPDPAILFPDKFLLKKKAPVFQVRRIYPGLAAAAAVILLFILIRNFRTEEAPQGTLPVQTALEETTGPGAAEKSTARPDPVTAEKNPVLIIPSEVPENLARISPFRMDPALKIPEIETPGNFLSFHTPETRVFAPVSTVTIKEKSIFIKVADNLVAEAGRNFMETTRLDEIKKPRLNFWTMISTGIKGYNKISDREIEFYVHRDEDGKISSYALVEQDRLILSKDFNKE